MSRVVLRRLCRARPAGPALVALATLLAVPTLRLPSHVDESALLNTAARMAGGAVLYRDVFTHHFPLPYALSAATMAAFGISTTAVRASIWLFFVAAAVAVLSATRFRASVGLFALCWSVLRVMAHGHLAMYVAWSSTAIWALFALCAAALQGTLCRKRAAAALVGAFAAVALLSDPLGVYAVLLGFAALWRVGRRHALVAVGTAAALIGLALGALAVRGALAPFLDEAIAFNRVYSAAYLGVQPDRLRRLASLAATGLGLVDRRWLAARPWQGATLDYGAFDVVLAAGIVYRAALLAACARLALARRPLAATWLYALAVAAQANDGIGFRAAGFAAIAAFVLAAMATGEWAPPTGAPRPRARPGDVPSPGAVRRAPSLAALDRIARLTSGLDRIGRVLAVAALGWLFARSAAYALAPARRDQRAAELAFEGAEAARLGVLACGRGDVALGYWPEGSAAQRRTGLAPVGGYLFLWPWVARRGQSAIRAALAKDGARAIVVLHDAVIWDRWDTRDYLAPLRADLEARYVRVDDATWVSPALAAACRRPSPGVRSAAAAGAD